MAYFMKKLVVLGLMSAGLVACGGGGGSGAGSSGNSSPPPPVVDVGQITTPASNVLTVKGEQFEKQLSITQDLYEVSVHASGNQPIDTVTFLQKPNHNERGGEIELQKSQARFTHLDFDARGIDRLTCDEEKGCFQNTSYQLVPNDKGLLLNINFNQAHNELRHGGGVNLKPVSVSGALAFNIPAHWPSATSKRFTALSVPGELLWDGESFTVYKVKSSYMKDLDNKIYWHEIDLKGKNRKITLNVYVETAEGFFDVGIKEKDTSYFFSSLDGESDVDYTRYWSEDDQKLKLNFKKLKLKDYKHSKVLTLNGNLEVPKDRFDITVDGESIAHRHPATEKVGVVNSTKYYTVSLNADEADENGHNARITNALTLYQELDGHVWLNYLNEGAEYPCGSKTQGCPGLSLATDQKTWRFNNVNIDGARVNGTYYFIGVEK